MNAFMVWCIPYWEATQLIYADTETQAKRRALNGASFKWNWDHYPDMRALRMPQWDHPGPPCLIVTTNADLHPDLPAFYTE